MSISPPATPSVCRSARRCSTPGHPFGHLVEPLGQAHLLLPGVVERGVVARHDRQIAGAESGPEPGPVGLVAKRRRADELGPLEAGDVEVVDRQGEVLWAGLAVDGLAPVPGRADLVQGPRATDVDDVDRGVGDLGEHDGPPRRLALGGGRTGGEVVLRGRLAGREVLVDEHVDDVAVLGVDAHQGSALLALLQRLQKRRVVDHDGALVGHEELEAGHAFVDQHGDLGERVGVEIGDGHVQPVVHATWPSAIARQSA